MIYRVGCSCLQKVTWTNGQPLKIGYNWHDLILHEAKHMLKIKNAKKKVRPDTPYPNDVSVKSTP